jgi:hypothetical protein
MSNPKDKFMLADRGMALVMVIVFTGALMVLGSAMLGYAINEKLIAGYHAQDLQKYYIAESGIETGLAALRHNHSYSETINGSVGEGHFSVTFSDLPGYRRLVNSEGWLKDYCLTISVIVCTDPVAGITVCEWIKP